MNKDLAIVFPGQGSQTVGMLSELVNDYPIIEQLFSEANAILGYDLWHLVQHGPAEKLNQTIHTQPALLVASIALWQIWRLKDQQLPAYLAGHSLGEYTALVAAEALSFTDAMQLVALRGQFMQEAVPVGTGAMAAVLGLTAEQVVEICQQASHKGIVEAANFNAPGQVVIAGEVIAVQEASELAKVAGAKRVLPIPVSVPSHCSLMRPAATRLQEKLDKIILQTPVIPVINNVDVTVEEEPSAIKDALIRQLYNPVRWVETMESLAMNGVKHVIECGPGKVLTGLNKRINDALQVVTVSDLFLQVS